MDYSSDNMNTNVSVVIPFYKRIDCIKATLDSVRKQTIKPKEILVVDDCSGEPYASQLKSICESETIITLTNNLGVSGARNAGAKASKYNWIAFLDSDDLWRADKLEKQLSYMQKHSNYCGCHTGVEVLFPNNRKIFHGGKPSPLTESALIESSWVVVPSLLIKKQDYFDVGGFDESMRQTEDYDFAWRLVTNKKLLGYIDKPLTQAHRGRDDHISSSYKGFIKGHVKIVRTYAEQYKKIQGKSAVRRHIAKYVNYGGHKCRGFKGLLLRAFSFLMAPDNWPAPTINGTKTDTSNT